MMTRNNDIDGYDIVCDDCGEAVDYAEALGGNRHRCLKCQAKREGHNAKRLPVAPTGFSVGGHTDRRMRALLGL